MAMQKQRKRQERSIHTVVPCISLLGDATLLYRVRPDCSGVETQDLHVIGGNALSKELDEKGPRILGGAVSRECLDLFERVDGHGREVDEGLYIVSTSSTRP